MSTISGPTRPSPIHFDDVDVPDDVMRDLTAAIQSTYGRHVTSQASRDYHVTSDLDPHQGQRNVLEELSNKLRSRDHHTAGAVTSHADNDVIKPQTSGHRDDGVRSAAKYPLSVVVLHLICIC